MSKLYSGAEIVFKCLEDQDVEHIFGYPGGAVLPIYDELKNHTSIKHISSSGVSVISETPDIANARIEFENGCVANLTASRVSLKNMRKTRFFQSGKYISVDFLNREAEVIEIDEKKSELPIMILEAENGKKKKIYFSKPEISENNAILDELNSFALSIKNNEKPRVDIYDGHNALDVAIKIIKNFK